MGIRGENEGKGDQRHGRDMEGRMEEMEKKDESSKCSIVCSKKCSICT